MLTTTPTTVAHGAAILPLPAATSRASETTVTVTARLPRDPGGCMARPSRKLAAGIAAVAAAAALVGGEIATAAVGAVGVTILTPVGGAETTTALAITLAGDRGLGDDNSELAR